MPMGTDTQGVTAPPGSAGCQQHTEIQRGPARVGRSYAPLCSQAECSLCLILLFQEANPASGTKGLIRKNEGLVKSCEKLQGGQWERAEGWRRGLWHGLLPVRAGKHQMPDL